MADTTTLLTDSPIPLLPLIRGVIFPGTLTTIPVGRPKSMSLVRTLEPGDLVAVGVQRSTDIDHPDLEDLYPVATLARVQQLVRMTNGGYRVILEGLERIGLDELDQVEPFWTVRASVLKETLEDEAEALALARSLRENVQEVIERTGGALGRVLDEEHAPGRLADRIAAELGLDTEARAELLMELDVTTRLRQVLEAIGRLVARSEVRSKIDDEVRKSLGKNQREAILREQLRAIKKELGEIGDEDDDDLRSKLEAKVLPEEVRKVVDRELSRMESLNPAQAEFNVIRTYLEWIEALPWTEQTEAAIDLDAIQQKLDEDHFGLKDPKQRILEHMAVLKVAGEAQATILCMVGPPGVGKTSLAQSVADAIDRPLVRLSLGGVRDEAEIRGHRRTYVGALPGRLINAMRKAEVNNPVIVLDEIDKLGQGWMGSPEAALLEVLDPEQNRNFTDHYMELPFDLSNVLFICTANDLSNLSAPLRDRMEIIEISGYTPEEKFNIARNHLLPKALEGHNIPEGALELTDDALRHIVLDYTREAGVRQLNQRLTKLARSLTLEIARAEEDEDIEFTVGQDKLTDYLGKVRFFSDVAQRTAAPGVATGLAWTPTGGDILFIETTRMPGKGRLEITGQLGDVMQESAKAALAYVRTHARELGIDQNFLESSDLHIHVPAGAVPKDGPSAGVTIFTALTSLLTGRKVRPDTAMTGECSLRG
ncbi:MAG: endopeptidase La, partial [Myxococcota bacterium]